MKVLIALCYENGDTLDPVRLALADGSTIDLDHEHAQTHVQLNAFLGEFIEKETPQ